MNDSMVGFYAGTNLLNLSWLPAPEYLSDGTIGIEKVAGGNFWQVAYTWSHEGVPQTGVMLLGISSTTGEATLAWGDSWHQSNSLMILRGALDTATAIDSISVLGSYPAESGPDWGWRIALMQPTSDTLEMVMTNIMLDGTEDLAVRATYTRTSPPSQST